MRPSLAPDDPQVLDGKIFAFLSYVSILCIIPLAIKKDNPFVLAHGKQGLILFMGEAAVFIATIILGPWFFKLGVLLLGALSFMGMMAALNGRYVELPVVSHFASKITL